MNLLLVTILIALAEAQHANFKYWCGKKYNSSLPHFDAYNLGSPDNMRDLPRPQSSQKVRMVQEKLPYLSNDTNGAIVAYIPSRFFAMGGNTNISISIASLNMKTMVGSQYAGKGYSFPLDLSKVSNGMTTLEADLSYASYHNGSAGQQNLESVFFDFYKVDPPSNGSYVVLDAHTQALSVNGGPQFVPVGYYVSSGFVFNNTVSNLSASASAAMTQYASGGYNVFMYSGPISTNDTEMEMTLNLAAQNNLYYQADVTDIVDNITALEIFTQKWSSHANFLSYYIGNEPDGPEGIGSFQPIESFNGYEYLKMVDPYHPVTLVTNCAHSAPDYAGAVDFLSTDVYSVGIPTVYNNLVCNLTQGDCGCDLCNASNPIASVADRYDSIYSDLGVNYPAVLFVEQTFSDNTYWSRLPLYEEELAMAWISIVAGGNGVLGYTYPVADDPTSQFPLSAALQDFASQMANYSSSTLLTGPRVGYSKYNGVYSAAWSSGTIIAVNAMNYTNDATILTHNFGLNGTSVQATALGKEFGNQTTRPQMMGGAITDQLKPYSVRVYTVS